MSAFSLAKGGRTALVVLLALLVAGAAGLWWWGQAPAPLDLPTETTAPNLPSESERTTLERSPERERRELSSPQAPSKPKASPVRARRWQGLVIEGDQDLPVAGVRLAFVGPSGLIGETTSDQRGHFDLQTADGVNELVITAPEGFICAEERRELGAQQGDILILLARAPGYPWSHLRGELLSESGSWKRSSIPAPNSVWLELSDRQGRFVASANLEVREQAGALRIRFEFPRIVEGEYELSIVGLSAWPFSPASQTVRLPANQVVLTRLDGGGGLPLVFEVFAAESGERIDKFEVQELGMVATREHGIQVRTRNLQGTVLPRGANLQWVLFTPERIPFFGDASLLVDQGQRFVVQVRLEKGYGIQLLALQREPALQPVAQAEVWVDGQLRGLTDFKGRYVVRSVDRPGLLELRGPGMGYRESLGTSRAWPVLECWMTAKK